MTAPRLPKKWEPGPAGGPVIGEKLLSATCHHSPQCEYGSIESVSISPYCENGLSVLDNQRTTQRCRVALPGIGIVDRKSTRLNSSHQIISYAVFCLKKKTKLNNMQSYSTRPL